VLPGRLEETIVKVEAEGTEILTELVEQRNSRRAEP
jgi:hypothetical protein